jgi:hypothetical protein
MFPVRYATRQEKLFSMTVSSVRYMPRPKIYLSKTLLYKVHAEVEDTVEHDHVLCGVHAKTE